LNTDSEGIGKVVCSKCSGVGVVREGWFCSKCWGDGKLDWIENVVGRKGFNIKPGVYTKEVDLSNYIFCKEFPERWLAPPGFNRSKS